MWSWDNLVATLCTLQMPSRKSAVAIVGGGITGSCAASVLAKHFQEVVVFDQGRRGPGGRASHRSVRKSDGVIISDDNVQDQLGPDTLQFDHGCQFFRADSKEMSEVLLPDWISNGWVAPWEARLGCLNKSENAEETDFFGLPARGENVYIGVGGMHLLPRNILKHAGATVHRGTRVTSVRKKEGKWELRGTRGNAAYHDTKESDARKEVDQVLGQADVIIFTDISSSSDDWHRASAGVPHSLRQQIPDKSRLPLFTCMVALSHPISDMIPYDGFTVGGKSDLWFAARSQSKPGIPQGGSECWTLISTPSFAVNEIKETTMRDPATGAFRPQENSYLNSIPGPALFEAFLEAIKPYVSGADVPEPIYLQAQRWGSGLPVPNFLTDEVCDIVGTRYCSKLKSSLVYPTPEASKGSSTRDYIVNDELRVYYAGDFCSHRNPGFEASALSGVGVARHIVESSLS